jgi:hypothetical protein
MVSMVVMVCLSAAITPNMNSRHFVTLRYPHKFTSRICTALRETMGTMETMFRGYGRTPGGNASFYPDFRCFPISQLKRDIA